MNNKRILFIPFLVLIYFFVHFSSDLFYFIEPFKCFMQLLKYAVVTALAYFAGYKIFKNKDRYTLAFSTILFIFLFFGTIIDTAAAIRLVNPVTVVDTKLIIGFLAVCIIISIICSKLSQSITIKLLKFWLVYCILLLVYDSVAFIFSVKKENKYLSASTNTISFSNRPKPSIFFLLLDMYPSDTILKKYMTYDNVQLNSFLKEKGFFVTGNAHSLYEETYYSISSTLSLKPLEYIHDNTIKEYKKKLIALKNIEQPMLLKSFEKNGYIIRNYSVFNIQGAASPLQFNLNYHLDNVLTSATFFNRFYNGFEPDFFLANRNIDLSCLKKSWSSNIKSDLATLQTDFNLLMDSFPNFNVPSFNYFHFMMPHPPIIYDSSGKEHSVKDMYNYNGFEKTITNFTSYTKYANNELMKMVDTIFKKAGKNVIIVIQGDHGYREAEERFPDAVKYGILNAVYLPGKNYSNFNDSMTPIFTFRQVLENQFGVQNKLHLP